MIILKNIEDIDPSYYQNYFNGLFEQNMNIYEKENLSGDEEIVEETHSDMDEETYEQGTQY